jgi:hypothetical protein
MKKNLLQKNNLIIVCCLFLFGQGVMSQTIEKWYVNMPDILNPTLTKQNRLELLEYHKAGQGDSVINRFGNESTLLSLDTLNQQILVKNTPSSTFEMKMLTLEDSTKAIGIIRTVCAPVCQSSVEMYDTAWNSIPVQFSMPKAIEWLDLKSVPSDKIDIQWAQNLMGVGFISLHFSAKGQLIEAKNNTLDFLSAEDRKVIVPYVSDKILTFALKGRSWQRQ